MPVSCVNFTVYCILQEDNFLAKSLLFSLAKASFQNPPSPKAIIPTPILPSDLDPKSRSGDRNRRRMAMFSLSCLLPAAFLPRLRGVGVLTLEWTTTRHRRRPEVVSRLHRTSPTPVDKLDRIVFTPHAHMLALFVGTFPRHV